MLSPLLQGAGMGAGLIIAIGAQNAHVLRTGLRRQHVGLTVAACVLIDVLAIAAGVAGMGTLIGQSPLLLGLARWGGALFLAWYGFGAARRALRPARLTAGDEAARPLSAPAALGAVLAVSLLNPHLFLDTVVLLGALGGQQPSAARPWFTAGAAGASAIWFIALGYGARFLAPWFARPAAWRLLDGAVAAVMGGLAAALAVGA
jgi:L-lysine exporter family protein LysE/ArgO